MINEAKTNSIKASGSLTQTQFLSRRSTIGGRAFKTNSMFSDTKIEIEKIPTKT